MRNVWRKGSRLPDFQAGIAYWSSLPPTIDTVLGGLASTSLPLVDALSSRQLILSLFPHLRTFPSPHNPKATPSTPDPPARALDVGAGIGRVTSSVLLHMFTFVDVVEPVESFLKKAVEACSEWRGVSEEKTGVRFVKAGLQQFDPTSSTLSEDQLFGQRGKICPLSQSGYDLIWCQWCLGHLSDKELASFLQSAKKSLRKGGFIIVKENVCGPDEAGDRREMFDEEDSTVTRSDGSWRDVFAAGGLTAVRVEVQGGFPEYLFTVKSYVLQ